MKSILIYLFIFLGNFIFSNSEAQNVDVKLLNTVFKNKYFQRHMPIKYINYPVCVIDTSNIFGHQYNTWIGNDVYLSNNDCCENCLKVIAKDYNDEQGKKIIFVSYYGSSTIVFTVKFKYNNRGKLIIISKDIEWLDKKCIFGNR